MQVTVNFDLCCGHGICVDLAPDLFELREDGKAYVIVEPDESMRRHADDAARACPQMAIDVID
jgi:ferredoxin